MEGFQTIHSIFEAKFPYLQVLHDPRKIKCDMFETFGKNIERRLMEICLINVHPCFAHQPRVF